MTKERLERLHNALETLFPERHLYLRTGGEMRAFVLSTRRQAAIAGAIAVTALWMGVCTAAMTVSMFSAGTTEQAIARERAKSERWIADREARLNSAVAQLVDKNGSIDALAETVEKRHAALAMLITGFKGQGGPAVAAPSVLASHVEGPVERVRAVQQDQERLISQAETYAKSRADRLRLALRLAGLDPAAYSRSPDNSLGGPLIEAKDPRALAAVLDVDEGFAQRIQRAANDMQALRAMNLAAQKLPLARPTDTARSSGFGVRADPFTRLPAYHPGLDFSGAMRTPVHATAPGIVAFTGVRSGYGNTIEIDHGGGFKTRYAHLQGISVATGERIALGQRIGAMGSTGRSTGPHLHYEVWVNGRVQNPDRFLKAGEYVQQAN